MIRRAIAGEMKKSGELYFIAVLHG
jgi:hypothetical protein